MRALSALSVAVAAACVWAGAAEPAAAQRTLYTIGGTSIEGHLGHGLAALDDVDGDQVPDFAAAAPGRSVIVFSGVDGHVIRSHTAPSLHSLFGQSLASADVDGDGLRDLLVGAPGLLLVPFGFGGFTYASTPGQVYAYSGADGELLQVHDEPDGIDFEFGWAVSGIRDVDGDDHDDILVGAPANYFTINQAPGKAYLLSGRTGQLLQEWSGELVGDEFGCAVASLGDVDGDTISDVAIGARQGGYVGVYSGLTGARIAGFADPALPIGESVAGVGDVDADGVPDLLAGTGALAGEGVARVVSGATGKPLQEFFALHAGGFENGGFGAPVTPGGDIDGDGVNDVLIGSVHRAAVSVFSGRTGGHLNTLGSREIVPPGFTTFVGGCAVVIGDVNADGIHDIAMGEPFAADAGSAKGRIHVIAGGEWPWEDMAGGVAGSGAFVPPLRGIGTLAHGSFLELWTWPSELRRRLPAFGDGIVHGRVILGAVAGNKPFKGGVLVPSPDVHVPFAILGGFIDRLVNVEIPAGLPPGFSFYVQALYLDPGAPGRLAMSNALQATIP